MEDGMKVKKGMIFLCAAVFLAGTMACGGGKYADAKKTLAKSNKVMESFLEGMEKADSADQVAKILTAFNEEMKSIRDEMAKLEEKYPDLMGRQEVPPELGEIGQKTAELWMQFPNVFMKAQQYAENEQVQKALEELQNMLN